MDDFDFGMSLWNEKDAEEWSEALRGLWQLPAIQATYAKRGGLYSFRDNMDYWFDKVQDIMDVSYMPSAEDVIRARVRTTGVAKYEFTIKDADFEIFDVGGQKNERKKWLYQFADTDAVIWVAALNHYNAVLFEDENKNAMHDAIEAFEMYVNRIEFYNSEIILFLNKSDLFAQCIKDGISLCVCFSEEAGW